jgi:PAS domain S-box-containing protein
MKSFLGVPIIARGQVVGNLYLTEKRTAREFSETDARLVEILARHAAVAIENASLYRSIERQQQRLQAVVEQLPEAVLLAETEPERITLANQHAARLLGWPMHHSVTIDELLARNQRFDADGALLTDTQIPLLRSLRQGEEISQAELVVERPDGTAVTLLANSAPLRDEQGHITGAIAVFQDITQIKDAEQLKDDFLSLVSHELRTPLTTIQAGATMLVRDADRIDADLQHEILEDISMQGYRLGVLVENMVQLAHIRAGRRVMEREPVHVESLVRRAISSVRQLTGDREVTVRAAPQLVAEVNADRIEQVITNMLHNAIKYSSPATPIEVDAARRESDIVICVRDYGSGIDAADSPFVFDRFRRGASAEASATPGMGLGLYLSRHVVEAHGGTIWVDQPEGAGTRICFSVPGIDPE